jgi:hypothetical protein
MMEEKQFWQLIDASRAAAIQAQEQGAEEDIFNLHLESLREGLQPLTPVDLVAFALRFYELRSRAYRWDLWAAAYWSEGGCSDDGFMDFRSTLISLGKDWYYRILAEPDALVETLGRKDFPYMQSEGFPYVEREVYEQLTGKAMPDLPVKHPGEPAGEQFDFDDPAQIRKRLPGLFAKFPKGGP